MLKKDAILVEKSTENQKTKCRLEIFDEIGDS